MSSLPWWLKKRLTTSSKVNETHIILQQLNINSVCNSAWCPNMGECFARHTATFMILGNICTRKCRFCAVRKGKPGPVDAEEPKRITEAVAMLGLRHVVITSVNRDDLPDGGAGHFVAMIKTLKENLPGVVIEVLTPDFRGDTDSILRVVEASPDIFNHNVETVPRLYHKVRPTARYLRSLAVLQKVKEVNSSIYTKSGLLVGLGEKPQEVHKVMRHLRSIGCDMLTIGQYLQPTPEHLPVQEFIHPDVFSYYEGLGREIGFACIASGPFVRSSYHAESLMTAAKLSVGDCTPGDNKK